MRNRVLHKSRLATQAALAMLRRLNIVYKQDKNTGLVSCRRQREKEEGVGGNVFKLDIHL